MDVHTEIGSRVLRCGRKKQYSQFYEKIGEPRILLSNLLYLSCGLGLSPFLWPKEKLERSISLAISHSSILE